MSEPLKPYKVVIAVSDRNLEEVLNEHAGQYEVRDIFLREVYVPVKGQNQQYFSIVLTLRQQ